MDTWKILATLLLETFAGENSKKFANIVTATKDQPQDSPRKPPIKIDHEFVSAEDELKGF